MTAHFLKDVALYVFGVVTGFCVAGLFQANR